MREWDYEISLSKANSFEPPNRSLANVSNWSTLVLNLTVILDRYRGIRDSHKRTVTGDTLEFREAAVRDRQVTRHCGQLSLTALDIKHRRKHPNQGTAPCRRIPSVSSPPCLPK